MTTLWRHTAVSTDGTHHVANGRPVYQARFVQVLSFHAPGLAAVRDARGAYHIDISGCPVYSRVFSDTFGFYENLAAVREKGEYFHILPDGDSAYKIRYRWCGNFQSGRAVVRYDSGYGHIFPDGRLLCREQFLYAGDFRERRAVVRLADGLCAHITEEGNFAHANRYRDLDVYHKGFARARDEHGWMHIDRNGIPAYKRRFMSIEPFYNGRALAETQDGEIVTIDERGKNIDTVLSAQCIGKHELFDELSADMAGYWKTYALAAAVKLAVADKLPIADSEIGITLNLPIDNARILMHALTELNMVEKIDEIWRLTAKGELLCIKHPHSLSSAALAWALLSEESVENWLNALSGGKNEDVFSKYAVNQEKNSILQSMLAAYARHDYKTLPNVLPLDGVKQLIDAGGGNGTTANIIAGACKDLQIVVLDKPEVFPSFKDNIGINPQITFHPNNIFLPWDKEADAVLLARVLHDWSDAQATVILRNARSALSYGKYLFIVERVKRDLTADGLCSLHLLTVSGGKERTLAEYQNMMLSCGFIFLDLHTLDSNMHVIIGEAK